MVAPAASRYDVVALRVEFQPDTTRFTTGDGTFAGLMFPTDARVDPLPHDAGYFRAHLAFLEDYIGAASQGRTRVVTHLLDEVVRVSKPMAAYSPQGFEADTDPERARLAALVHEAWSLASQVTTFDATALAPGRTAFVLFHAGVGRDVELVGTSLDKTPQDLPSLFFDHAALIRLGAGDAVFRGIPVDQTAIIPRTESRLGTNSLDDSVYLLELSINGLLAASFVSYLGVPDLFNTVTGESAIGPFGLMDPLGIFAYAGLFPPLPGAWTRVALGWADPIHVVESGPISLSANEVAHIPVSEAEYFLVENRVRDAGGDGVTLTIWEDGAVRSEHHAAPMEGFSRFDVDAFGGGVVTSVSNYDFALPGLDADGMVHNGGALIWHVDERQFGRVVNNNPEHRAVDLEEADGAQDLGFDNYIGSVFDFYYEGNPASVELPSGTVLRLWENRFGPDTTPDSRTNGGGESFVELSGFSSPGPVITFEYRRASGEHVTLIESTGFDFPVPAGWIKPYSTQVGVYTGSEVVIPGLVTLDAASGPVSSPGGLAVVTAAAGGYAIRTYDLDGTKPVLTREWPVATALAPKGPLLAVGGAHYALFTDDVGSSEVVRVDATIQSSLLGDGGLGLVAVDYESVFFVGRSQTGPLEESPQWTYHLDGPAGAPVMGRDGSGLWGVIPGFNGPLVLQPDGTTLDIPLADPLHAAVLADINSDGFLEIVTMSGSQLVAYSMQGAVMPPFPVELGARSVTEPLVFEMAGAIIVAVATRDGHVHAIDVTHGGAQVEGFPLSVGHSVVAQPLLWDQELHVISTNGRWSTFLLPSAGQSMWSQYRGSAINAGFGATVAQPDPGESLLVDEEVYNWPNPVRSGFTHFRVMARERSEITITIADLAGMRVDELHFSVSAGTAAEYGWETSAASGIYFARVRAQSDSGRTETRLIKLAVIQ